ncbi:probable peptide chain release factor C12orf65, mitochondrial isoform X2 [Gigantopelta aegis]|nr:probable peptide chain release factor C12orf65, mitochondrial isoform X2 [Gigantopelta aegis]XP_041349121.1 probable peptide chain release factor C12orf65, mitochondrial isoform X2 [Gigantopelta aegis]
MMICLKSLSQLTPNIKCLLQTIRLDYFHKISRDSLLFFRCIISSGRKYFDSFPNCLIAKGNTNVLMIPRPTVFVVRNFSTTLSCEVLKKTYVFLELKEGDLKEIFVRGSGPGGQSVNKTANCVVLQHIPTGVTVKCHETRSLDKNRRRARERLQEQVDFCLNGENSFLALRQRERSQSRLHQKKTNRHRLQMKKAFKEREGLD